MKAETLSANFWNLPEQTPGWALGILCTFSLLLSGNQVVITAGFQPPS